MNQNHHQGHLDASDDIVINSTQQPAFIERVNNNRRSFLKGGIGATLFGMLNTSVVLGCSSSKQQGGLLGFASVPVQISPNFDTVLVAEGYKAQPFLSWGDALFADAPQWVGDGSEDWKAQLLQAGDNHDGMHFFPFPDQPNERGLLVINHEYVNNTLHGEQSTDGFLLVENQRLKKQVLKEQAAHGVTVIEIAKTESGDWVPNKLSKFNRRISALTEMAITGPLKGMDAMKTEADPRGEKVTGTLNNCSMGVTPWGTYLICEENWHKYFANRDEADYQQRASHHRYGVTHKNEKTNYGWETIDPRFNATQQPDKPFGGHVNEPHRFGWVVEFDPFNPNAIPKKRTALGRLCRECATVSLGDDGSMAVYSGDDTRGEYIYKFVPSGRFKKNDLQHNANLLDEGQLYVAKFNDNGTGQWLALRFGESGLTNENGFEDQASVLLNARGAADQLGATPMDRPEWVAVHPDNREVYVTLTNNVHRGTKHALNAANPRENNVHGHIIKINEHKSNPAAESFRWDMFLLAGEEASSNVPASRKSTINGDIFSSPDGLCFDEAGRLWIQTDYDDRVQQNKSMGCNQLLCADPTSREVRRFLVGPRGCEITGITFTPDHTAMWINVQHPKLSYPASDGISLPRSTTVLVTKDDGGVIGS